MIGRDWFGVGRILVAGALLACAGTSAVAQDAGDTTRPVVEAPADTPADTASGTELPLRESTVPWRFAGTSRFVGQLADRKGLFQEIPEDYARFELIPTLLVYDVPFSANLLLSTEQNERRQSINSLSFGLDFRQLQATLLSRAIDKVGELQRVQAVADAEGAVRVADSLRALGEEGLRDLERLKNLASYDRLRERAFSETTTALQELGVLSATEKFFLNFPALEFGVTYPRYTPLTLSSVPVNGANIEFNPGEFYVAFAGGSSQRARTGEEIRRDLLPRLPEIADTIIAPTYERTLYAGRIGVGRRDASHFFFTTMWARDDESDAPIDSIAADTLGQRFAPKSNLVLGFDVALSLAEDLFRLEGEINGSVINNDVTTAGFKNDDIPGFLVDLVDPTISTSIDYAYTLRSIVNVTDVGSKLTGSIRMIGPGYQSLGAPTLRNDLVRYDLRFEQKLLNRQIALSTFYRHDADNLIDWKPATTEVTAYGVGLGLTLKKLPYLRINWAPYHQSNDLAGERAVDNTTTTFSAISGYAFRTGPLTNSANITYSLQRSETNIAQSDYGVGTLGLNYTAIFQVPLTLNLGVSFSDLRTGTDSTSNIVSFDIGGSFVAWDIWESSVGVNLSKQPDVDNRFGFFVGSSVALWDYGYLDLRAEKSTYTNSFFFSEAVDEFIFRTTLTTRW
jgi:hypothetical protein